MVLFGCFGFVLVSCGQGDFGLRDLSSESFVIPSQLIATEKISCSGPYEITYIPELIGAGVVYFDEPTADHKVGQLNLRILNDGTFTARYREFLFENTLHDEVINGRYGLNIVAKTITLPGVGEAAIKSWYSSYKVTLSFTHNLNSTELKGQKLDMYVYKVTQDLATNIAACQ